jgi:hypothetical protein
VYTSYQELGVAVVLRSATNRWKRQKRYDEKEWILQGRERRKSKCKSKFLSNRENSITPCVSQRFRILWNGNDDCHFYISTALHIRTTTLVIRKKVVFDVCRYGSFANKKTTVLILECSEGKKSYIILHIFLTSILLCWARRNICHFL